MKNNKYLIRILVLSVLMILLTSGCIKVTKTIQNNDQAINSFAECAKLYPVMESYPRRCRVPNGKLFVEELTPREMEKLKPPVENCKDICGDGICQEVVCDAIGCPCAETASSCPQDCVKNNEVKESVKTAIANPASVNCQKLGGKLEIRNDSVGNQTGYCIFPNGKECEEWALFQKECDLGLSSAKGVVEGKVTVGPICPVERPGVPCKVPPEAYTSREVIVYKEDGKTEIERKHFDTKGHYRFELAPGNYVINIPASRVGGSKDLPKDITISAGKIILLNFDIDTGIR